jgi:serine/threonine-protein kinase HipA
MYRAKQGRWRLTPAVDVVPNPVETPRSLTLQLSTGRFDISREAVLVDAHRFGFAGRDEAGRYLDLLLARLADGFDQVAHLLEAPWQEMLRVRLQQNLAILRNGV